MNIPTPRVVLKEFYCPVAGVHKLILDSSVMPYYKCSECNSTDRFDMGISLPDYMPHVTAGFKL